MTDEGSAKTAGETPLACGWVIQFRGVREIRQLATTPGVSPYDEHFAVPEQRRRETYVVGTFRLPVTLHVPACGSYNSALAGSATDDKHLPIRQ